MEVCSESPMTGYNRNGKCETNAIDLGSHLICATVTKRFLEYTKSMGNDLSTPRPNFRFPGLKDGDNWCLCVSRWVQAQKAGVAPPFVLRATNKKALPYLQNQGLDIEDLENNN